MRLKLVIKVENNLDLSTLLELTLLIVTFSESECFSREVLVLLAKVRVNVASDCVAAGDVIDELIDSIHLLLTGKLNISVIGGGALEY